MQELSAEFLRGLSADGDAAGASAASSLDGFERSSIKAGSDMAEEVEADDDKHRVRRRGCERLKTVSCLQMLPFCTSRLTHHH